MAGLFSSNSGAERGRIADGPKAAIVTFHTNTEAMKCGDACKRHGIAGRLVSIPRDISAGCGYAWRTEAAELDRFLAFLERQSIEHEAVHLRSL